MSVVNIKGFSPLVVLEPFALILFVQELVHVLVIGFYLLEPNHIVFLTQHFVLLSSFSLFLFKSQLFLSSQIQIPVLQNSLVRSQSTVSWRYFLDDPLMQMIQLYSVAIETVLVGNRKMAFGPNHFLFTI